jgi:glycosyltransferase involved in cell wall biosynthesis
MEPLVSVIVPAYNCGRYLAEALTSALGQGYTNQEIIVVDDGSTDDTLDVARRFGGRVRVVSQENRGPAAARNRGAREARGEFLAFLDGDDIWLPGKTCAQVAILASRRDVNIVYGGIAYWTGREDGTFPDPLELAGTGEWSEIDTAASGDLYTKLLLDSVVCIISTMVRRTVFEELQGFDENLVTGEDYDFWLRVSRSHHFTKLRRTTALYRLHAKATTRVPRPVSSEYRVLTRAIERFGTSGADGIAVDAALLKRRMAKLCFDHGYSHFRRGSSSIAWRSFVESLRYSRLSARTIGLALLSWARSLNNVEGTWR